MAAQPMAPDALLKHPEYPHIFWALAPAQKGSLAVAKDRGGPLDVAFEVHGHGPLHLVVRLLFGRTRRLIPRARLIKTLWPPIPTW
jgi:hypothetical protein